MRLSKKLKGPQCDVKQKGQKRGNKSIYGTNITVLFSLYFWLFRAMPKVKRSRKPPPDGWELIEPTLDELDQKMREGNVKP